MQDIIDEVLEAESSAGKTVGDAHKKASELKSRVEDEISRKIKEARAEAQKLIREAIAGAKEEAEAEFELAVRRAEEENSAFMKKNEELTAAMVDKVAALLITPEYKKE